ncbi:hypothetical protein AURDEDRAFT_170839 [Auricularia subglabra TFB-10046 SS5]|nr:hypothetical protein AURDEDRAFT_170839 [Auricularia subglabra TFB-10046 SS5]
MPSSPSVLSRTNTARPSIAAVVALALPIASSTSMSTPIRDWTSTASLASLLDLVFSVESSFSAPLPRAAPVAFHDYSPQHSPPAFSRHLTSQLPLNHEFDQFTNRSAQRVLHVSLPASASLVLDLSIVASFRPLTLVSRPRLVRRRSCPLHTDTLSAPLGIFLQSTVLLFQHRHARMEFINDLFRRLHRPVPSRP